jgi:hypothetical protein
MKGLEKVDGRTLHRARRADAHPAAAPGTPTRRSPRPRRRSPR